MGSRLKQVVVVPHDPQWADAFRRTAYMVTPAMGDNLLALHHIGSTSIPGIHAKPIIDLLAVVADLAALDRRNPHMEAIGFTPRGEYGIPGRRYFPRDDPATGLRTHHLHAFQTGSPHVARHLAFRDFLRAHPTLATQYSDLKRQLAAAHPNDIEAYMDGKDEFIKRTEAQAIQWLAAKAAP